MPATPISGDVSPASSFSDETQRMSIASPWWMPACFRDSMTLRYASGSATYLPTSAMGTLARGCLMPSTSSIHGPLSGAWVLSSSSKCLAITLPRPEASSMSGTS